MAALTSKLVELLSLGASWDLPTIVSRIIEEVDGAAPTPQLIRTAVAATPATFNVTPDRRSEKAILVDLRTTNIAITLLTQRITLERSGVPLIEGVCSVDIFSGVLRLASQPTPTLQAPIVLSSSEPLRVALGALPGESDPVAAENWYSTLLYCSARAAAVVTERLGQARWWSLFAQRNAALSITPNFAVALGGRPTYFTAIGSSADDVTVTVTKNEATLTQALLVGSAASLNDILVPLPMPHTVVRGDVYQAAFTAMTDAATRGQVTLHGPSWDY